MEMFSLFLESLFQFVHGIGDDPQFLRREVVIQTAGLPG